MVSSTSLTLLSIACDVPHLWTDISCLQLPSAYKLMCLDSDDQLLLVQTYQIMYPGQHIGVDSIAETAPRYATVIIAGEKFGSKLECHTLRSARVMALWAGVDGEVNTAAAMRPGQVKFYMLHFLKKGDKYEQHLFGCVRWYSEDAERELYRRPVEVWKLKTFDSPGAASFIPVQRLYCKFAVVEKKQSSKLIISPILRSFC